MKSFSNMKVYPINWETSKKSISKNWVCRYIFTDKNGIEHECAFRGMNHLKTHAERVEETKRLVSEEVFMLEHGYNPKTKEYEESTGVNLVTPSTLFLIACNNYIAGKEMVDSTRVDMENSMKHISKYATLLKLHLKQIKDVTKGDVKQILLYMKNDGHSNYRINKTRDHLSSCFSFFTELDIFLVNFIAGISKLQHKSAKKNIIRTKSDWKKFHSIKDLNPDAYAFMFIFLYCGSRFEEMANVRKEDVILEKSIFWITLKKGGQHTRVMRPINIHTWEIWKDYYDAATPGQYLFSHNQRPNDKPVKANSMYDVTARYFRAVGLNLTGYCLKYTFINLVTEKYGIAKGAELAGHTNTNTTKIYAVDYEEQQVEKNKNIDIQIKSS